MRRQGNEPRESIYREYYREYYRRGWDSKEESHVRSLFFPATFEERGRAFVDRSNMWRAINQAICDASFSCNFSDRMPWFIPAAEAASRELLGGAELGPSLAAARPLNRDSSPW